MKNEMLSEDSRLRKKAEEQLKKKSLKTSSELSEADTLKLLHELQVHQIELEMQNEKLQQAKEEAENANQKYTELYDFAPMGYFTLSIEGNISELNILGAKMLGKGRSQLVGSHFGFFVTDDKKPTFNQFLGKVYASNSKEWCKIILLTNNDLPQHVLLSGVASQNRTECHIVVVDITELYELKNKLVIANKELVCQNKEERKRASELASANEDLEMFRDTMKENEIHLLELNADRNKFFSIIAHDLRSPFTGFLGFTQMLVEELDSMSIKDLKEISELLNKSATHLYTLLDNLLNWTSMKQGLILFKPQKKVLADICNDAFGVLLSTANAKNIIIHHLITNDLTVFADIEMLKTILRNLVSNAIKFTNNGGEIHIHAEQTTSDVIISITDNGVGIKPEVLSKLFEISDVQTTIGTANEKGTGLGLLLCKEFVERHGGRIWVESEYLKGTSFRFSLPIIN